MRIFVFPEFLHWDFIEDLRAAYNERLRTVVELQLPERPAPGSKTSHSENISGVLQSNLKLFFEPNELAALESVLSLLLELGAEVSNPADKELWFHDRVVLSVRGAPEHEDSANRVVIALYSYYGRQDLLEGGEASSDVKLLGKTVRYEIGSEVFAAIPGYTRGVVVAWQLAAGKAKNPVLEESLKQTIKHIAEDPTIDVSSPRVEGFFQAYEKLGLKGGRQKVQPNVAANIRRIRKGQGDKIPFVNNAVACANIVQLKHIFPTGLISLDGATDLYVGKAAGSELFQPAFENKEAVPLNTDEFAYFDRARNLAITRAFNTAPGRPTILEDVSHVILDVDAIVTPNVTARGDVEKALEEAKQLLTLYCQAGRVEWFILDEANPYISIHV